MPTPGIVDARTSVLQVYDVGCRLPLRRGLPLLPLGLGLDTSPDVGIVVLGTGSEAGGDRDDTTVGVGRFGLCLLQQNNYQIFLF